MLLSSRDGDAPAWLREGIAEYVGSYPHEITFSEREAGRAHLLGLRHELPATILFGDGGHDDYSVAHEAVRWLVQIYGMPRLLSLLDACRRDWDGSADIGIHAALKQTYRITLAQVETGAWSEIRRSSF